MFILLYKVDGIELSGLDFSARAGEKSPFYLDTLLQARNYLDTPVWLVGGVFSRREADRVLRSGVPFVSFSRALICEPDFIAKLKAGQTDSRCLACNGCYNVYRRRPVRCVQHTRPIPQLEEVFHHKIANT